MALWLSSVGAICSGWIQPLYIIANAFLQRIARFISKRGVGVAQVGLREILIVSVRIFDVIGLKIRSQNFVQSLDQLIKSSRLSRSKIVDAAGGGTHRSNRAANNILHVNEIPLLLAVLENARTLTGLNLLRQMINHAGGNTFVRFARAI